ncbi:hypothetical protein FRX31_005339 [Thalictrum thalictroides]|uniref:Uncharacterized protein n=1 Tax=Thalictrum thalictroides TaxID=46969 RepID=A0A7J6X5I6_THATH|nr:hypothetical protein FRX31_005339 [Thalictrum thalictroides]
MDNVNANVGGDEAGINNENGGEGENIGGGVATINGNDSEDISESDDINSSDNTELMDSSDVETLGESSNSQHNNVVADVNHNIPSVDKYEELKRYYDNHNTNVLVKSIDIPHWVDGLLIGTATISIVSILSKFALWRWGKEPKRTIEGHMRRTRRVLNDAIVATNEVAEAIPIVQARVEKRISVLQSYQAQMNSALPQAMQNLSNLRNIRNIVTSASAGTAPSSSTTIPSSSSTTAPSSTTLGPMISNTAQSSSTTSSPSLFSAQSSPTTSSPSM